MISWAFTGSLVLLGLAVVLGLSRILRGPSAVDRILGLDTVIVSAIAVIVLASAGFGTWMFVDLLLAISLLIFFSTSAMVFYLARSLRISSKDVPELVASLSETTESEKIHARDP